ncbi:nucleotidyltransferase domain-containing protein [Ramlibacter sp.]|uniref:nucleotidyltransferase family protein n=1 Tax=Ramlibacter sp. TaxID=1917967 RepID=UPI0018377965|nr:nucleotidyltransferase domain-containing protein [Ramlibacter sp.]MBA2674876.1 nucleotidyltransferase domain-containing protein [Ramlibacter sp.]
MEPHLHAHLDEITALCRRYGVAQLELFGSAANGEFRDDTSDYDFLVELDERAPGSKARRWIALAEALEQLLGRHVDLVSPHYISNPFFRAAVDGSRMVVYDGQSPQAAA